MLGDSNKQAHNGALLRRHELTHTNKVAYEQTNEQSKKWPRVL